MIELRPVYVSSFLIILIGTNLIILVRLDHFSLKLRADEALVLALFLHKGKLDLGHIRLDFFTKQLGTLWTDGVASTQTDKPIFIHSFIPSPKWDVKMRLCSGIFTSG